MRGQPKSLEEEMEELRRIKLDSDQMDALKFWLYTECGSDTNIFYKINGESKFLFLNHYWLLLPVIKRHRNFKDNKTVTNGEARKAEIISSHRSPSPSLRKKRTESGRLNVKKSLHQEEGVYFDHRTNGRMSSVSPNSSPPLTSHAVAGSNIKTESISPMVSPIYANGPFRGSWPCNLAALAPGCPPVPSEQDLLRQYMHSYANMIRYPNVHPIFGFSLVPPSRLNEGQYGKRDMDGMGDPKSREDSPWRSPGEGWDAVSTYPYDLSTWAPHALHSVNCNQISTLRISL